LKKLSATLKASGRAKGSRSSRYYYKLLHAIAVLCVGILPLKTYQLYGGSYFGPDAFNNLDLPPNIIRTSDTGTTIIIPPGVTIISSTMDIPPGTTLVQGSGIGNSILRRNPSFNGCMVRSRSDGCRFTGFTIDGNGSTGTNDVGLALTTHNTVDTVEVKDVMHIGIATYDGCIVNKCILTGPGPSSSGRSNGGIWFGTSHGRLTVSNNVISKWGGAIGIFAQWSDVAILNNRIFSNGYGPGGGGQIDVGTLATNSTVRIIGNDISRGMFKWIGGLELHNGRLHIENNDIHDGPFYGIHLDRTINACTISNNRIYNNGQYTADEHKPQLRAGIVVPWGCRHVYIDHNHIYDNQTHKTQAWAVMLLGGATGTPTGDITILSNNDLAGNIHQPAIKYGYKSVAGSYNP
jgi:parallel beta-helix repeat protein